MEQELTKVGMLKVDTIAMCKALLNCEIREVEKDSRKCVRGWDASSYKKYVAIIVTVYYNTHASQPYLSNFL